MRYYQFTENLRFLKLFFHECIYMFMCVYLVLDIMRVEAVN